MKVSCAIIERDGKVLCAQRSASMKLPLKWEFPGGKIEAGETAEQCLIRECNEELNLQLEISAPMPSVRYEYAPGLWLELIPFRCNVVGGELELREHASAKWLKPKDLPCLDWAEADIEVVQNYLDSLQYIRESRERLI